MKPTILLTLFGVLGLLVTGCHFAETASTAQGRYQIVASTDGGAWRLDASTGEVKRCVAYTPVFESPACWPVEQVQKKP